MEIPGRQPRGARYPAHVSIVDHLAPDQLARISRDVYVRMIDEGMLAEDARIQLLEGVLVEMSPQGDPHVLATLRVVDLLRARVGAAAHVVSQVPFNATPYSRPEPDVALWPPVPGRRTQVPDRLLLAVEVADSSLRIDRMVKAPIYAAAAVPEYWIIHLADDVLERYTAPTTSGYARVDTLRRGDTLTLVALPDITLAVADLLPEA